MEAVILFTRYPEPGKTKTRLMDFLTKQECAIFSEKMLKKLIFESINTDIDVIVSYTPGDKKKEIEELIFESIADIDTYDNFDESFVTEDKIPMTCAIDEEGKVLNNLRNRLTLVSQDEFIKEEDLGVRMRDSIIHAYRNGYERVVLFGSDIPDISSKYITRALDELEFLSDTNSDTQVVISPTYDGGYCLIGFNIGSESDIISAFESMDYGHSSVFHNTVARFEDLGFRYRVLNSLRDIDTKEDLFSSYLGVDEVSELGSGEYNLNYTYRDPLSGKKKVFRINMGSQMNLENQIEYEFRALKELEDTGVTPRVYWYDDSREFIPYGVMSMEFLKGRPLDYDKDMEIGAYLLAKIHNKEPNDNIGLVRADKPFRAMYEEFESMFSHYEGYERKNIEVEKKIRSLLDRILNLGIDDDILNPRIINTELNNRNFIIGDGKEDSFVIDWEKPIISDPEQDIAHFIAPTTTFWKTDKIFDRAGIEKFLDVYERFAPLDRSRFYKYLVFTCLRGITWCSMAFVEYNSVDRVLKDDYTYNKICAYLEIDFLDMIDEFIDGMV